MRTKFLYLSNEIKNLIAYFLTNAKKLIINLALIIVVAVCSYFSFKFAILNHCNIALTILVLLPYWKTNLKNLYQFWKIINQFWNKFWNLIQYFVEPNKQLKKKITLIFLFLIFFSICLVLQKRKTEG